MTTHRPDATPAGLLARVRRRAAGGRSDEGGFILLETMIAITLITVVMAAVSVEYVNGMAVSAHQRSTTVASQVATSAMSDLRGLDPTDLTSGRTKAAVIAQRTRLADIDKVKPWVSLEADRLVYDDAPDTAAVPTTRTQVTTPSKTFGVEKYVECSDASTVLTNSDATQQATCGATSSASAVRAVVVVTWSQRSCPSVGGTPTCAFVTSTLIDVHANPTFDLNQPLPPAPVTKAVPDQVKSVGDVVSLDLLVEDGKGAAPFTWALTEGTLPTGLSLSPAGQITGTIGAISSATTTFTVTDAFLRTAQVAVKWSVATPVTVTKPTDRVDLTGTAITPFNVVASGGNGTLTYTDPTSSLPTGISMSAAGRISGTPSRGGTYSVTLRAADSAGRAATTTFSWVVNEPLGLSNPGDQVATVNRAEQIAFTATGGTAPYRFTSTALPAGLALNASTGLISGSPSSTTAAAGTTVTVTVTDAKNQATTSRFNLKVVAAPSITTPAAQATTAGGAADVQVSATCANTPCTYALANAPAGLSISSGGRITGTVATSAASSTTVRVTVTDAAGASAQTGTFAWTVNRAPSATTPADRTTPRSTAVNVSFAGFFSGGTAPYTYSATGLPAGLSISSSGVVTGTTANANSRQVTRITATDASGVTVTASFTWWVSNLALSMPATSVPRGQSGQRNLAASTYTTGGTSPYSYDVDNLPPGFSLSGTTVSGAGTTRGTWTVTVTVTDSVGASVTTPWTFTVT